MTHNIFKLPQKLLITALTTIVCLLAVGESAHALITNSFPSGYTSNRLSRVVALSSVSGSAWGLDAPETEYKIYLPTAASRTINIQFACEGDNHGGTDNDDRDYEHTQGASTGVSQTRFELYRTNSSENVSGSAIDTHLSSQLTECNSGKVATLNANNSPKSGIEGHQSFNVYILRVTEINASGTLGSGKGFRIGLGGLPGFVSVSELNANARSPSTPSTKAYALIDGIRGPAENDEVTTYRFDFRANCDIADGTRIYLKWSDADVGIGDNAGNIAFRLRRGGPSGPAINVQPHVTPDGDTYSGPNPATNLGSPRSVVNGQYLMGGNVGENNQYGLASFSIERDVVYTWEWTGVKNVNALQFWLPFSEINAITDCPTPDYDLVNANCDAVSGYFVYGPVPSQKYNVNIQFRIGTGAWGTPITVRADDSTPDPPGQSGLNNGFNLNVPIAYKSATQTTSVRAWVENSDGSITYISTGTTLGTCDGWFDLTTAVTTSPSAAKPGDSIVITYSICNNDDEQDEIPPAQRGTAPNVTFQAVNSQEPGTQTLALSSGVSFTSDVGANSCLPLITRTATIPATAQVGDEYCTSLRASKNYGYTSNRNLGGHPLYATSCVKITDGPYLQAWGNDIWSGGGYDLDGNGTCSQGSGSITSLNDTVSGTAFGALVEFGEYAEDAITQFGSGGIANDNHQLTFSNTGPDKGFFGADRCLSGLFDNGGAGGDINDALWSAADGSLTIDSFANTVLSGQYRLDDATDQIMNNGNFSGSSGLGGRLTKRFTVLVQGNLELNKNIVMDESGWSGDYEDIPLMTFIVAGNIYINPGVERLDGIYISKKTIDTCAIGTNNDTFDENLSINVCGNHLEVNGKFIANNIAFRRTWGGTNEARPGGDSSRCSPLQTNGLSNDSENPAVFYAGSNRRCAAESFRFNPALYLARPILDYGDTGDPNNFPIQQIRDLPPVY